MNDPAGRGLSRGAPPALDADLALVAQIGLDMVNFAQLTAFDDALSR